jgi:hypothetical protein
MRRAPSEQHEEKGRRFESAGGRDLDETVLNSLANCPFTPAKIVPGAAEIIKAARTRAGMTQG